MTLRDVIDICKLRLRNISKSLNDEYMAKAVHLGISDLYNRFNLSIKSEIIHTTRGLPMYEVRSSKCNMVLSLFDSSGNELKSSDVLDSKEWQWKRINYRSFLLNNPNGSDIVAVFKASPKMVLNYDEELELPEVFVEALSLYIVYMVSSTVRDQSSQVGFRGSNEGQTYRQMYEEECNRLIMMGYSVNLETERLAIQVKGYV